MISRVTRTSSECKIMPRNVYMFNISQRISSVPFLTTDPEFPRSHGGTILSEVFPWQPASYAYTDTSTFVRGVSLITWFSSKLSCNRIISAGCIRNNYTQRIVRVPGNRFYYFLIRAEIRVTGWQIRYSSPCTPDDVTSHDHGDAYTPKQDRNCTGRRMHA